MVMEFIKNAAFAAGVTLAGQIDSASVLDLITKLRPQNCGKDLIRIGSDRDGGYLLPDDLEGIQYCFSPGVGASVDFENHLALLKIKSFLADYSIDRPPVERPEFTFDKKYLGANDTDTFFTLKAWKERYLNNYHGDLLLQMDIEGSEYETLISTPAEVLSSFRIMLIEFHYLNKMFDPLLYTIYKACFEKVLTHFHVAHIHPNNCCGSVKKGVIEVPRVMEFTFYNKNRVGRTTDKSKFPDPLDRDNVATNKPLELPKCWYRRD
jgi:hypothetical protein